MSLSRKGQQNPQTTAELQPRLPGLKEEAEQEGVVTGESGLVAQSFCSHPELIYRKPHVLL